MPSLSSHSKHEEFLSNSALQIKNQKKIISEKGKGSKNSMNQLNSNREQWNSDEHEMNSS